MAVDRVVEARVIVDQAVEAPVVVDRGSYEEAKAEYLYIRRDQLR